MNTLFDITPLKARSTAKATEYSAKDIEVLEGLEPVRKRPGMYIGGTDQHALHHMIVEVLDNSMDEATAGYATHIIVHLHANGSVSIADNGRGIPVDPHPKYPDKSALEVIMTTLHSGGKFGSGAYYTAGGLHGVGVSVVNALSAWLEVQVIRKNRVYTQRYERGIPTSVLTSKPMKALGHGTTVTFYPDVEIFGDCTFIPTLIRKIVTAKAYLHKGVHIIWRCDRTLLEEQEESEQVGGYIEEHIQFPNGLQDYLRSLLAGRTVVADAILAYDIALPQNHGRVELAITWLAGGEDGTSRFYCNTVHNPNGGTHELGLRSGIMKAIRNYATLTDNKKAVEKITIEDVLSNAIILLSLFIPNPAFQGQTKEKLLNPEANKLVETAVRDNLEQWMVTNTSAANALLDVFIDNAELRRKLKQAKEVARKSPIKSLRLPGKLADCFDTAASGSELFIVEGDSAGGTAKQARDKRFQAILPLKGKILNVASNSVEKIKSNQEVQDLLTALGCSTGNAYRPEHLRYDKVIIMTDADVDGAHIASLLMVFFYLQIPQMIHNGHLYLAQPPLYKLKHGTNYHYAHDEVAKDKMVFSPNCNR